MFHYYFIILKKINIFIFYAITGITLSDCSVILTYSPLNFLYNVLKKTINDINIPNIVPPSISLK